LCPHRFPIRSLQANPNPFRFQAAGQESAVPETVKLNEQGKIGLDELLASSDTVTFLIVKDDEILYERYYQGHTAADMFQVFSASKSLLSILIGIAIDDGLIESVDQPETAYVPELAEAGFDRVTIEELLHMQSNMDYFENDDMLGEHVALNYPNRLEAEILKFGLLETSDAQFRYKSGENALLGLILTSGGCSPQRVITPPGERPGSTFISIRRNS
jgi:CubicO group peptidase (beta-lactamase class C family)